MFEQNYRAAMGKLSAAEGWRAETLCRMREAQAEPPREERETRPPLRLSRKAALLCAAALVLLVVPLGLRGALLHSGVSSAAAEAAPRAAQAADAAPNLAGAPFAPDEESAGCTAPEAAAGVAPELCEQQGTVEQPTEEGFTLAAPDGRVYYVLTEETDLGGKTPAALAGCRVTVTYEVLEDGTRRALCVAQQSG